MKKAYPLSLFIQFPDPRLKEIVSRQQIRRWVSAAQSQPAVITIRFVDEVEGKEIHHTFCGKNSPTNVLTFVYDSAPPDLADNADTAVVQADIIICTDIVLKEATEQEKAPKDHLAHLIVHGTLHAQGMDHENGNDATEMEKRETEILARFQIADPYG